MASTSLLKASPVLDKSEWVKGQSVLFRQPSSAAAVLRNRATSLAVRAASSYADELVKTAMIFQLHAVYGEWLLRDFRWDFVVDDLKGGRLFLLNEDSTHAELVAMAQEDYNLDMRTVSVEISYSLPAEMMMAPGSLPIHVTSDRQVRNLLEILKTHRVCLCVSSRSKVETVSEKRDIDEAGEWEKDVGDNDEAGEWEEDVGDDDEAGEWEEDVGDDDEADECFEDVGDNEFVEDENQDGEEENGEEDADNSIVGETDQNGGDYSLYGKVPDEDEEDDDNICFEEIQKTYAKTNAIEGGKSNGTSIYVNQSFVSKGALLSELRLSQHIEERECFPPELKRGRGRPKKSRWQSWLELSRMRGHKPRKKHRARRCSNCKETGHTKPQCTQPVD